ncbi:FtsW/RodA/SpoVE family cell cycle protein [Candidatus Collierbacteria bacterium]|nr:FtsW/RodA/SpoVE family cell cycle protein [Candidatus Collierbacteria bacterium]
MRKPSYVFLIAALGLFISVIGLIAVYNASVIEGFNTFNDRFYFAKQQLNWLLLGVVAFVIATKLNLILQSDFGTAAIITSICFGLYFISGSGLKEIGILLAVLLLGAFFFIFSSPYRMQRLATFIDPTSDTLGRSYHINQVILGLGSGGMFGVGLGRSRQKYAYLPEAATDSIFAIVGEETGFVGGLVLISLLLSLCLLAFKIAAKARDQHQRLVAVGIALLFSAQTFVNLSSMVALIPLTGVPLPLISYGGSSLITNFISLGILASIARSL